MSALAMMFFQEPSILAFQKNLGKKHRRNNLRTLFNVDSIPKDNQMRDVMDNIDGKKIAPAFNAYFNSLQRGKYLEKYLFLGNYYLVAMDGSEYFSSDKICCPGCLEKEHKNGTKTFSHQIIQAAIIHPDMKQVIPSTFAVKK
ncbi:transposase [Candidatus Magnetobacterium bavaricum]|uniref:Transposase n=1 Tax=Candidatus Magnetobacterium bavaricum TaxID=29290 RepID=A0A0F3GKN2_9BACT|nr:transposase [Candidatus Magnetobacterium bavaricum]